MPDKPGDNLFRTYDAEHGSSEEQLEIVRYGNGRRQTHNKAYGTER